MRKALKYQWIPAKSFTPGRVSPLYGIVLHSGDGFRAGDISTLTKGKVSSHWYVCRDGTIFHFVQDSDTAYHAGRAIKGWNNASTIGIESEHRDGISDWPATQLQAFARLVAALRQKHGNLEVKGHSDIAVPKGRKRDPLGFPWDRFRALLLNAQTVEWVFERV